MNKKTYKIVKDFNIANTTNKKSHSEIVEKLIKIRLDIDVLKSNYKDDDIQSKLNIDHARGAEASLMWTLGLI